MTTLDKIEPTTVDYDNEVKATAILSGYRKKIVAEKSNSGPLNDASTEFARLLALITSHRKAERAAAKKVIQKYAAIGGWHLRSENTELTSVDTKSALSKKNDRPNKWRRWSDEDQALLVETWGQPSSNRDAESITQLSDRLKRTPFALIIRLYQAGLITVENGNSLCVEKNTPRLLSETNLVTIHDPISKQSDKNEDFSSSDDVPDNNVDESLLSKICVDCTQHIPIARLKESPNVLRCIKCQSLVEKNGKYDFRRYINEGIAGTREAHKILRGWE